MRRAHEEPGVQVFTKKGCGGCEALKAALDGAGVAYAERDTADPDDFALAMWYDLPEALPQVVVDGVALELDHAKPNWIDRAVTWARMRTEGAAT